MNLEEMVTFARLHEHLTFDHLLQVSKLCPILVYEKAKIRRTKRQRIEIEKRRGKRKGKERKRERKRK